MNETMLADGIAAARGADAIMRPRAEGALAITALQDTWGRLPVDPLGWDRNAARGLRARQLSCATGLLGLTWGAGDLSAAIGVQALREADGTFTDPYHLVCSLGLLAAHAAAVAGIETVYPAITDLDGLATCAARASRDGFTDMMPIDPN